VPVDDVDELLADGGDAEGDLDLPPDEGDTDLEVVDEKADAADGDDLEVIDEKADGSEKADGGAAELPAVRDEILGTHAWLDTLHTEGHEPFDAKAQINAINAQFEGMRGIVDPEVIEGMRVAALNKIGQRSGIDKFYDTAPDAFWLSQVRRQIAAALVALDAGARATVEAYNKQTDGGEMIVVFTGGEFKLESAQTTRKTRTRTDGGSDTAESKPKTQLNRPTLHQYAAFAKEHGFEPGFKVVYSPRGFPKKDYWVKVGEHQGIQMVAMAQQEGGHFVRDGEWMKSTSAIVKEIARIGAEINGVEFDPDSQQYNGWQSLRWHKGGGRFTDPNDPEYQGEIRTWAIKNGISSGPSDE
jgi:hypothetical protein